MEGIGGEDFRRPSQPSLPGRFQLDPQRILQIQLLLDDPVMPQIVSMDRLMLVRWVPQPGAAPV